MSQNSIPGHDEVYHIRLQPHVFSEPPSSEHTLAGCEPVETCTPEASFETTHSYESSFTATLFPNGFC